jgi:glucosamine-6-phosphate deaminase
MRAVVWLSLTAGRAILKLTEQDYTEHHLSPLLARHGAAGVINGGVFNRLGSKIRGRSKLPAGRTVICFSPHPDDVVISAGGILR